MALQDRRPFHLVNIGGGQGPRRDSIIQAYQDYGGTMPVLLTWEKIVDKPAALSPILGPDIYVRLDSPDQDERARTALYRLGQGAAEKAGFPVLSTKAIEELKHGDIGSPAQLVFGLHETTKQIAAQSVGSGAAMSINAEDLLKSFDKAACLTALSNEGLPTPDAVPLQGGFEALRTITDRPGMSRVFVKLRYGAAAAGTIALARNRDQWTATTTAVIGEDGRPYATRAIRRLSHIREIAHIVDTLAPLGLQVEKWLPKIGVDGQTVDLRIVVMGGQRTFTVLRSSPHPITNLHIGGSRGSADALAGKMGETAWAALLSTARNAARLFSSAQCVGVDMAVLADGKRHSLIEVNAFGDHVRDFCNHGVSVHSALMEHVGSVMAERRAALVA